MKTRPLGYPGFRLGMFVSGVDVDNPLQVKLWRNCCVDLPWKAQELL
jgi:hypothetical protein